MAKYVKDSFLLKNPPGARTPLTFIWPFTVPSNPGLAVPFSPAVPARTFSLIAVKLKEIEKCHVHPRESQLNFQFNGLSRFFYCIKLVRVFSSYKTVVFKQKSRN